MFEAAPVIDKDLLEDVPVPRRLDNHQIAPSEGIGMLMVTCFYHVSRSWSTPSIGLHRSAFTHLLALEPRGLQGGRKMKIPKQSS